MDILFRTSSVRIINSIVVCVRFTIHLPIHRHRCLDDEGNEGVVEDGNDAAVDDDVVLYDCSARFLGSVVDLVPTHDTHPVAPLVRVLPVPCCTYLIVLTMPWWCWWCYHDGGGCSDFDDIWWKRCGDYDEMMVILMKWWCSRRLR